MFLLKKPLHLQNNKNMKIRYIAEIIFSCSEPKCHFLRIREYSIKVFFNICWIKFFLEWTNLCTLLSTKFREHFNVWRSMNIFYYDYVCTIHLQNKYLVLHSISGASVPVTFFVSLGVSYGDHMQGEANILAYVICIHERVIFTFFLPVYSNRCNPISIMRCI